MAAVDLLIWLYVSAVVLGYGGRRPGDWWDLGMHVSSCSFRGGGMMGADLAEVVGHVDGDVEIGGAKPPKG